jgi:hypothetical protein
LVFIFLSACKTTKLVPEGQHLLVKNKIKTTDTGNNLVYKVISKIDDNKSLYIKHKPNRNIIVLGRFHLGMYNFGSSKKHPEKNESKKLRKLLRSYGEAPVLLDTLEVQKSEENLKNYLFTKGFLDCEVTHSIKYRKKKAIVTYFVIPSSPYIINNVRISADDADIDKLQNKNIKSSYFVTGQVIDMDLLSKERNRMSTLLRNNGYYDFSKDYIDFELDTIGLFKVVEEGNDQKDTIRLKNAININISIANKSVSERFHKKFIQSVTVKFENDSETFVQEPPITHDSTIFYLNGFPVNPHVIADHINLRKGEIFKNSNVELTYARLSEFTIFKFIDINFVPSASDTSHKLDAIITLKTNYRQSFTIEPQGIVSQLNRIQNINLGNSYGVANSLIWTHRNLFHNAELFEISSNTRIETQLFRDSSDGNLKYFNPAFQQSLNLSLSFPRATLLKPVEKWNKVKSIKTNLNLSYLYEKNPDYLRRILPLTYQYQIQTPRTTWFLNLLELSFSRNTLDIDISNRADSAFIQRLFSNNLITATGLNFLFTDKNTTKRKTHFYVRTNLLEVGGNIHRLIRRLADTEKRADTSYQLLRVDYYQYVRSEIDARCSTLIDKSQSTVLRLNFGYTIPYGNQEEVPFDKLFFIGGSNSLRAWRPRTIGPGSFEETTKNFRINRAGNLILQANAEYRFDIFENKLEGALFIDAGNVWLIKDVINNDKRKEFKPESIITETALGTGVGLRFDFQFFLFRLDWGMQMRNPEKTIAESWVIRDFARNNYFTKYSILNFGIGYPF